MKLSGWIFFALSWLFIIGLAVYCFKNVLTRKVLK